jgi:transposase
MIIQEVSMRERRVFSKEYKVSAIEPILLGEKSTNQVARELGIRPSVLRRWKEEYLSLGGNAFPGSGNEPADAAEVKRLKREHRRLMMENEILKKALAIFRQGPPRGTV